MTMSMPQQEWEGPFTARLQVYDATHTNVVQYRCQLEKAVFRYYVPKLLLTEMFGLEPPENIIVEIGKTYLPVRETGFLAKNIPPKTGADYWEYQYTTRKTQPAHSWLYEVFYDGQRYSLYVPHEVMDGMSVPKRLIVHVGVPNDTDS